MGTDIGTSRREFVAAMGASVAAATAIATSTESAAQNTAPLKIVDFHNHYMGPSLTLTNSGKRAARRAANLGED